MRRASYETEQFVTNVRLVGLDTHAESLMAPSTSDDSLRSLRMPPLRTASAQPAVRAVLKSRRPQARCREHVITWQYRHFGRMWCDIISTSSAARDVARPSAGGRTCASVHHVLRSRCLSTLALRTMSEQSSVSGPRIHVQFDRSFQIQISVHVRIWAASACRNRYECTHC